MGKDRISAGIHEADGALPYMYKQCSRSSVATLLLETPGLPVTKSIGVGRWWPGAWDLVCRTTRHGSFFAGKKSVCVGSARQACDSDAMGRK